MVIDDRSSGTFFSSRGTAWRLVTDGVMGGESRGRLSLDRIDGRDCIRLTGAVSLANNGGFVQVQLPLAAGAALDARGYTGVALTVLGNGEGYNVHLKTPDLQFPWQSYRAEFVPDDEWRELRLPFAVFKPYRTGRPLDLARLERLGIVAIGRAYKADVCVARLALYDD